MLWWKTYEQSPLTYMLDASQAPLGKVGKSCSFWKTLCLKWWYAIPLLMASVNHVKAFTSRQTHIHTIIQKITYWLYPRSIISFQALKSTCPMGLPKHPECTWQRTARNSFTAACRNTEFIVDWNDCFKLRVRPETWQNEMSSSLMFLMMLRE